MLLQLRPQWEQGTFSSFQILCCNDSKMYQEDFWFKEVFPSSFGLVLGLANINDFFQEGKKGKLLKDGKRSIMGLSWCVV